MPRVWLILTLMLLFLLEGTVLSLMTPHAWGLSWMTVPRFALVGVIMVALSLGRREGLYHGLALGLLHDVLYGHTIGVHTLTTMVAGYFAGLLLLLFHRSAAMVLTSLAVVLFGHEWLLYLLFRLFSETAVDVQWVLTQQILPTVALNLAFAMLAYVPLTKLAEEVREHLEMNED